MHEVLLDICSWAFSFSTIKMLFHTWITSFVPLIIFVKEPIHCFWIFSDALVSDRVDFVSIIFWSRDKFGGLSICKITFLSESHRYFVEIISFLIWIEETILYCCILMRDLLIQSPHARRSIESRAFAHWELSILKVSVLFRGINVWWWRWRSLKIYIPTREPWQLSFLFERPTRQIFTIRFYNLLAGEFWKVIITSACSVQISSHSFVYLNVGGTISYPPFGAALPPLSTHHAIAVTVHVAWMEHLGTVSKSFAGLELRIDRHYRIWWEINFVFDWNTYYQLSLIFSGICSVHESFGRLNHLILVS